MWAFLWFLALCVFLVSANIFGFGSANMLSDRNMKALKTSLAVLTLTLLANAFTPDRGMIFGTTGLLFLINGLVLLIRKNGRIPRKILSRTIGIAVIFLILGLVFTPTAQAVASTDHSMTSATTSSQTSLTQKSVQTALVQSATHQAEPIQTSAVILPSTATSTGPTTPLSSAVSASSSSFASFSDSEFKVHFLDVGQGTSTLFEIGDKVMIIDGGDREKSSFVVAYLKKIGIKKIDVMISTHYDSDHLNGLVGVLNVFPVEKVYDANYTTDTRVFASFKNSIQEKSIPEIIPGMKQKINVGNAVVTFVAPRQYGDRNSNDNYICVRVTFGQTSFLIMGDPSANAEQQILNQELQADVLLASHHGSDGSNSKTLLAKVNPRFVVISCGYGNQYGYPGHNALSRIKNIGSELYRIDLQSTIICTSDGQAIQWNKSPCNDFTPGSLSNRCSDPNHHSFYRNQYIWYCPANLCAEHQYKEISLSILLFRLPDQSNKPQGCYINP